SSTPFLLFSFFFSCTACPPALPSFPTRRSSDLRRAPSRIRAGRAALLKLRRFQKESRSRRERPAHRAAAACRRRGRAGCLPGRADRKSTRLNSSHVKISYAVFCLKKKKHTKKTT